MSEKIVHIDGLELQKQDKFVELIFQTYLLYFLYLIFGIIKWEITSHL